jgi:hypothetical protein
MLHPKITEHTFFSEACRTFSKIDHSFEHKASTNKQKKIETISCALSDYNRIKLEINKKKNYRKYPNTWKLNN